MAPVPAGTTGLNLVGLLLLEHVFPPVDASIGVGPPHTRGAGGLLASVRLGLDNIGINFTFHRTGMKTHSTKVP